MTDETKGDGMTLDMVRDWHRDEARFLREDGYDGLDHDALADAIDAHLAAQSATRVDEAISRAPLKLRGLAKVIREHGTCAAAALERVADEIQAATCKPQP